MPRLLYRIVVAIAMLIAAPAASFGLSLPTATSNTGAGMVFMNLTSTNNTTLYVTSFQTYLNAAAGTAASVTVYYRAGTYAGFTGATTGWTAAQTLSVTSAGAGTLATIALSSPITVPAGQTVAVCLYSATTGNGIRYTTLTGTTPPQTTWTNADMTLFSDSARPAITFGAVNTPRCFAGVVNYFRDPSLSGACCRQDGSCSFGVPADCEAAPAGLWRGSNSACATVTCQQPGACCQPQNAACTMLAQFACVSPNTFTAENTTCSPLNPCPQGACCKHDGSCTSVTQA